MDYFTFDPIPATRLVLAILLHFVWQATLIIALVAIVRGLVHPKHFRARYGILVGGLGAVLAFPLLTLTYYVANPEAMHALFPTSPDVGFAGSSVSTSSGLLDPFNAIFQTVFAWFDTNRGVWLGSWLIGFGILLLRLTVSLAHCFRLRRSQKPLPNQFQKMVARLKTQLNMAQSIVVGTSNEISQAVAVGIIKPIVLIPAAWITQLPLSSIEAVIAHELAHVKRWDLWVNFFQRFTETVFFFHPLVWWLSNAITNEREICCDALAVRVTGQPMRYVETLAHVAGTNDSQDFEFQLGTAFSGGKNMNLLRRAKLILEPASVNTQTSLRTLVLLTCVGLVASYGSYAYCANPTTLPSAIQDHERGHDQEEGHDDHDHGDHDQDEHQNHGEHRNHDDRIIKVRSSSDGKESIIVEYVVEGNENQDDDVHTHIVDLLHGNESGKVSPRELAQKLRQLADQIESQNDFTKKTRDNRRNHFEFQDSKNNSTNKNQEYQRYYFEHKKKADEKERGVETKVYKDEDGNSFRFAVDDEPSKRRIVWDQPEKRRIEWRQNTERESNTQKNRNPQRQNNNQREGIILEMKPNRNVEKNQDNREIEFWPEGKKDQNRPRRNADVGPSWIAGIENGPKKGNNQTRPRWIAEINPNLDRVEKDNGKEERIRFEVGSTSADNLGQVLRELKKEVQELRREVTELKSDRSSYSGLRNDNELHERAKHPNELDNREKKLKRYEDQSQRVQPPKRIRLNANQEGRSAELELSIEGAGPQRFRLKAPKEVDRAGGDQIEEIIEVEEKKIKKRDK